MTLLYPPLSRIAVDFYFHVQKQVTPVDTFTNDGFRALILAVVDVQVVIAGEQDVVLGQVGLVDDVVVVVLGVRVLRRRGVASGRVEVRRVAAGGSALAHSS